MHRFKGNQGLDRNNRTNYLDNNFKTSGNTGDYMQLIGNIVAAVGDSLQAYGQAVSIAEDEQQQIEQQQEQQQVERQIEQLKQQVQQQQEKQDERSEERRVGRERRSRGE